MALFQQIQLGNCFKRAVGTVRLEIKDNSNNTEGMYP